MTSSLRSSRRELLIQGACGGASFGLAGLLASNAPAPATEPAIARPADGLSSFTTAAKRPRGLAASKDGRMFVAGNQGVLVYGLDGHHEATVTFNRPVRSLAVCDNGDLLVALAHHIERLSAQGERLTVWESVGNDSLLGALATAGEESYAADAAGRVIWRFNGEGRIAGKIDRGAPASPALSEFVSLAVSTDGLVHVANPARHRVETYDHNGRLLRTFGEKSRELSGFSGCCNPVSLALLSDGRLLTAERGLVRIKSFDERGNLLAVLAGPEQFQTSVETAADGCVGGLDLAKAANDRVVILDRATGKITVIAV